MKRATIAVVAAAVMLLSLPTFASASWKHSGVILGAGQNAQLQAIGTYSFQGELGGVQCEILIQMTLTGGQTTGHVTQFQPNGIPTTKCKPTGLTPLFGCTKVEAVSITGLPWTLHRVTGQPKIQITAGVEHYTMYNNSGTHCVVPEKTLNAGNITMDIPAAQQTAITSFQFSGELETSEGEGMEVSGTQVVQGAGAGTYGMT